ncbi:CAP domain-containing protein [Alloiococcus sp. CFN-8]|uniref:CAP domain-containing protein n=1 Tax=Alloiococcus sp. CFN-8 TaxID=3416081 RepID=UPI003CEB97DA
MLKKFVVVILSAMVLATIGVSFQGNNVIDTKEAAASAGGETLENVTALSMGKGFNNIGKSYKDALNKMGLRVMLKVVKEPMNEEEKVIDGEAEKQNLEPPKEVVEKQIIDKASDNNKKANGNGQPQKVEQKPAVVENKKEAIPVKEPTPVQVPAPVVEEKVVVEQIVKELPANYPISYRSDIEDELLVLVNQLRAENGLAPLTSTGILKESSRYKSNSMIQLGYFNHNNPNYNNENSGYLLLKIFKVGSSKVGENIAMYTDRREERINAKGLYDLWYNSEPHRKAMLSDSYTKIGIGVVTTVDSEGRIKIYGTQHFAK